MNAVSILIFNLFYPLYTNVYAFIQNQTAQTTTIADQLDTIERTAALSEKYGLSLILLLVCLLVLGWVFFAYQTGKIVPRNLYDKTDSEKDEYRNQLIEQMNINRTQNDNFNKLMYEVIYPLKETLSGMKKEDDVHRPNNNSGGSG